MMERPGVSTTSGSSPTYSAVSQAVYSPRALPPAWRTSYTPSIPFTCPVPNCPAKRRGVGAFGNLQTHVRKEHPGVAWNAGAVMNAFFERGGVLVPVRRSLPMGSHTGDPSSVSGGPPSTYAPPTPYTPPTAPSPPSQVVRPGTCLSVPVVTPFGGPSKCANCGGDNPPFRCTQCHAAEYCNQECQYAHWRQHSGVCKPSPALIPENTSVRAPLVTVSQPDVKRPKILLHASKTPFTALPVGVVALVLRHVVRMSGRDALRQIAQVSRVCHIWREAAAMESVWDEILHAQWGFVEASEAQDAAKGSSRDAVRWKQQQVDAVWARGHFRGWEPRTGHHGRITAIQWEGDRFVTGAADHECRIWDARSGCCVLALNGHAAPVRCVWMQGDTLITGSQDGCVRVWHLAAASAKVGNTMWCTTAAITCLYLNGAILVAGTASGTCHTWDLRTGQHDVLGTFTQGIGSEITCLYAHGDRVMAGSAGGAWCTANGRFSPCDCVVPGHEKAILCLQGDGNLLATGSADCSVKIWNLNTLTCERILQGHTAPVTCLQLHGNKLITGSDDCTVQMWDVGSGKRYRSIPSREPVSALAWRGTRIVTGEISGACTVWDGVLEDE